MNKKIIVLVLLILLILLACLLLINNNKYVEAQIKEIYKDNNSTVIFVKSESKGMFELVIGNNTKIKHNNKIIKETDLKVGDNILVRVGKTMLLKEPPMFTEVYEIKVIDK